MSREPRDADTLITVGEVIAPHGVEGAVRVWPTTDFPERFAPEMRFVVKTRTGQRTLTVASAQPHRAFLLVHFREVNDRDDAEALRGLKLQVPQSELIPLDEGEFYRFELLGLTVVTDNGVTLGIVEDILETGANDVFVVAPAGSGRTRPILLPATREVVIEIDGDEGTLRVRLLPGLLEV